MGNKLRDEYKTTIVKYMMDRTSTNREKMKNAYPIEM